MMLNGIRKKSGTISKYLLVFLLFAWTAAFCDECTAGYIKDLAREAPTAVTDCPNHLPEVPQTEPLQEHCFGKCDCDTVVAVSTKAIDTAKLFSLVQSTEQTAFFDTRYTAGLSRTGNTSWRLPETSEQAFSPPFQRYTVLLN